MKVDLTILSSELQQSSQNTVRWQQTQVGPMSYADAIRSHPQQHHKMPHNLQPQPLMHQNEQYPACPQMPPQFRQPNMPTENPIMNAGMSQNYGPQEFQPSSNRCKVTQPNAHFLW